VPVVDVITVTKLKVKPAFVTNATPPAFCDCKRPDRDRDRLILSVKTDYFVEIHGGKNDRGANKSLIIHKAFQNNRNNIV
jgi:hypothetical protein